VILSLIALAATVPSISSGEEAAFKECTMLVKKDPQKAISEASSWRIRGGGVLARQCLGLAYVELERWAPAAATFEQAAREAEAALDPRSADFWAQSGNAWLAAGESEKAQAAFDAALATSNLTPELRGEIHLDRARAGVALGDLAGARKDIDKGIGLVGRDPFAWYLSAALALREGNMARAANDMSKAVHLAPDDANVLLQAGTIAGTSGDIDLAKSYYMRAIKLAPDSNAGRAAKAALEAAAQPQAEQPDEEPEDKK
jgi:tetratricopeptide (TPR) repeat protein